MIFSLLAYILSFVSVCAGECKIHTTVLRQLRKEGFHLELLSTIEIIVGSEYCPAWENCTLALGENIGSSFYVNPDELKNLKLHSCIPNFVDIERPQNTSQPITVYLYSQPNRLLNLVHTDFKLPLHLRYHSHMKGGGYILTGLFRPSLLLQCRQNLNSLPTSRIRAPCSGCSPTLCDWVQLPFKTNAENLTVAVPVGDSNHLLLVTTVTYLLAFGGAIYLCLSVLQLVTLK